MYGRQLYLPKPRLFLLGLMKLIDWLDILALSDGWLEGDLFAFSKPEKVLLLALGGINCWGGL
jgi:hypothetical protein